MVITSKDKNLIIDSLLKKFANYPLITYDYIKGFIEAYENDENTYDGFDLNTKDYPTDTDNPHLYISFKVQSFIYNKLCSLATEDADILLGLVDDKMRIVNMVAKRFNFTDEKKKEDYLMDALTSFTGDDSIDTHITRYVIAKIKGVPYETKREQELRVKANREQQETAVTKKDKKKKKKNKVVAPEPVVPAVESVQEVVLEPVTKVEAKEVSAYDLCLQRCSMVPGSKEKDEFVETFLSLGTYDVIDYKDNKEYTMYMLLRFGMINDTFYSLVEISQICELDLRTILGFEKYTIEVMRKHINEKIDYYYKLVINN